jgi:hypothetical protein
VLGEGWHGTGGLQLARRRGIATATSSGLCRGQVRHGPDIGVGERGNHSGFPVHRTQAKLTVAEVMAKARRGRWSNDGGGAAS